MHQVKRKEQYNPFCGSFEGEYVATRISGGKFKWLDWDAHHDPVLLHLQNGVCSQVIVLQQEPLAYDGINQYVGRSKFARFQFTLFTFPV